MNVDRNDATTPHAVTVKDAPVDAFWSATFCNADGYLEARDRGVNGYSNSSAERTRVRELTTLQET